MLAQRAGSDGFYWEIGAVVTSHRLHGFRARSEQTGSTQFEIRLFQVSDSHQSDQLGRSARSGVDSPVSDFDRWARGRPPRDHSDPDGSGPPHAVRHVAGGRYIVRIDSPVCEAADSVVRSEAEKHRHAVAQVVTWTILVLVYFVMGVLVIQRLGVPITSLVAPATVAGVAVGFGAQRVVQDILAGFFIISERQYGFGDMIQNLCSRRDDRRARNRRERDLAGNEPQHSERRGPLRPERTDRPGDEHVARLGARCRGRARAGRRRHEQGDTRSCAQSVTKHSVTRSMRPLLLDAPSVMGLESMDVDQFVVRVVARTLPGKQFEVGRDLSTTDRQCVPR